MQRATLLLSVFFVVLALVAFGQGTKNLRKDRQDQSWWQNTIVYQVYPRSYQDSDNDGTGDLAGILSKIPYLVDLGVETIWFSPIYRSPMADFGYDISDFTDIDPIFGTLADFQELSSVAHANGLKIVMDFVPNHSSNEHEWFLKSVQREEPYTDYYIWRDPSGFDTDGNPLPPNNWLSVFRFSAWEWNETRGQFYYHAFTVEQPDLNYRNPLLVEEMKNVLRFWVGEQGVDGFRMDAVPFMFEDPAFPDEPESGKPVQDDQDYNYLDHIYTFNLPEVYDMIAELNGVLEEFEAVDGFDRVVMVEALSEDLTVDDLMRYYESCDFAFNFNYIVHLFEPLTAGQLLDQTNDWLNNMPAGATANWVLGNHDNWRVGSRFGAEFVDGMNMISMLLPGVAVTYAGEEMGLLNNMDISFEETVDPRGINCGPDHYAEPQCSRDPERTPMQWNSQDNAGFTGAGVTPWLPVRSDYITDNVEAQSAAVESHLKVYKALARMRMMEQIRMGDVNVSAVQTVFAFNRLLPGGSPIIVALNTSPNPVTVDILNLNPTSFQTPTVSLRSVGADNAETTPGSTVDLEVLSLNGYEAVVIELA